MTENKQTKTFETLNVKPELVRALKEDGIINPTEIQEKTIPLAHQGKDVIGISRTGSGKTASFGVPLLEKIQLKGGVQGLVLAPTRELANQISGELQKWGKSLNVKVAVVFGGVGMEQQVRDIARSEVVVGTPGRLLDHLSRGNLNLSKVNTFVLDEADKMVEMGFIEDIEEILSATPKQKQVFLYGATISNEIDYLKKAYMNNVALAEAELQVKKDLLKQYYYNVKTHEKFSLLVHLLKQEETGRVMIFCSKRSTVELVNRNLRDNGIKAEMIHGKMTQSKRLNVIDKFNKDKTNYLVASAVAARGLDIKDVTHVFNYDLSPDPQEYIHRVGRTARAGESGKAITLLSDQDHGSFHSIFNRFDVDIEELPLENFAKVNFQTGRSGNRNGFNSTGRDGSRPFGRSNGGFNGGSNRNFRERSSGRSNGYSGARSENGYSNQNQAVNTDWRSQGKSPRNSNSFNSRSFSGNFVGAGSYRNSGRPSNNFRNGSSRGPRDGSFSGSPGFSGRKSFNKRSSFSR
ncbi:MAG: DEAD/DEAH box helicase [Nanoarchaeota archaeon]|nr:DEAD/DEAH box helicase [Nanoarchaeota archaeon]MBU1976439.1 DEAD/DEAH box helicase [Nanoarchaeota archaeon]